MNEPVPSKQASITIDPDQLANVKAFLELGGAKILYALSTRGQGAGPEMVIGYEAVGDFTKVINHLYPTAWQRACRKADAAEAERRKQWCVYVMPEDLANVSAYLANNGAKIVRSLATTLTNMAIVAINYEHDDDHYGRIKLIYPKTVA